MHRIAPMIDMTLYQDGYLDREEDHEGAAFRKGETA
jgi:hypothetical protein